MKVRLVVSTVLAAMTLVGCGAGAEGESDAGPSASPLATAEPADEPSYPAAEEPSPRAEFFATAVTDHVASALKITVITEDNDPNNLIGRPGGYLSAAVIRDKDGDQSDSDPGVAYGATVEVFEDKAAAQGRSDYIQGILKDNPMLGTEYNYLNGAALLRVSGDIKPSVASQYEDAFMAAN